MNVGAAFTQNALFMEAFEVYGKENILARVWQLEYQTSEWLLDDCALDCSIKKYKLILHSAKICQRSLKYVREVRVV